MAGRFLVISQQIHIEHNIFADKSSLILEWLLFTGIKMGEFSIREVSRDRGISVGLVQRIFGVLLMNGYLQTMGLRTAKKFILKKPESLLKSWLEQYSIMKKCKMWTYSTGLQSRQKAIEILMKSPIGKKVAFALHSAAEDLELKNTNIQTLELYMLEPSLRQEIEEILLLEPQERGYQILLVEPYYKTMLNAQAHATKGRQLICSPPLLAFLDLYNFPLRGREQAEFMAERIPELKRIYQKS